MKLYLGIDGGGSKTKVSIISESENLLFENTSGPTSIDTVDNQTTYDNLVKAIQPYIEKYPETYFAGVFAGVGGIVFEEDCELVEEIIKKLPQVHGLTYVQARNDMENALYSGLNFEKGIALISGTGMVAFGKNKTKTHKCGGWGYREGEYGSAYNLGREAIRFCIRAFDGRYQIDDFAREIAGEIKMRVASDIMKIMDVYYGDRTKTAKLSPIVTRYANTGNTYAKQIVDKATDEIALAVKGVYNYLEFEECNVVVIGSLGNSKGYFREQMLKKIKAISPNIEIIKPQVDPSHAAAIAAKRFSEEKSKWL